MFPVYDHSSRFDRGFIDCLDSYQRRFIFLSNFFVYSIHKKSEFWEKVFLLDDPTLLG